MKKLLILILIILSVILIYYIFKNDKKTYTAVGDFYANGMNSYNDYRYGYVKYLRDILEEKDKLKAFSDAYIKNNYSIEKMLNDIKNNDFKTTNGVTTSVKQVLREADILTITIGINDLLDRTNIKDIKELEYVPKKDLDKELTTIKKDLNRLILEIKKYSKKDIILVGYYFPNKIDYPNSYYISKKFDAIYKHIANKNDLKFISSNNTLKYENINEIYPNYKMYKELAKQISKNLQIYNIGVIIHSY